MTNIAAAQANRGMRDLSLLLELFNDKKRYEAALEEFDQRKSDAEKAEASLQDSLQEARDLAEAAAKDRAEAESIREDVERREGVLKAKDADLTKREQHLTDMKTAFDVQMTEVRNDLKVRENAVQPREEELARRMDRLKGEEGRVAKALRDAEALKAEYEGKLSKFKELAG